MRAPLPLAALAVFVLVLAPAALAQPADFTQQQASVYEAYRLSLDVRTSSGYVATAIGYDTYDIRRYDTERWRGRRGRQGVSEVRFYEIAGRDDVAAFVRKKQSADWALVGIGAGMVGAAVLTGALLTDEQRRGDGDGFVNWPIVVLGTGATGLMVTYFGSRRLGDKKTSAATAAEAASRYNGILVQEIRNAGPDAGAGGR